VRPRCAFATAASPTFGYCHTDGDTPRAVLDQYLACIGVAAGTDYISAKIPGLGYSTELFAELAAAAAKRGLRIHIDAEESDNVGVSGPQQGFHFARIPDQKAQQRCPFATPGADY
jgi:hypothetical protein